MGDADAVVEAGVTVIIFLAIFALILITGPFAPPGAIRYLMLVPFLIAVASAAGILILYIEDKRRKGRAGGGQQPQS